MTAALFFGGAASPSSLSNATLSYDGTNWTVEESMSTTRSIACGSGTSTAALAGGGLSVPSPATNTSNSEEYGGEAWTAGGTMLAALREHRAGGTQTDTLEFGGRIQGAPPTIKLPRVSASLLRVPIKLSAECEYSAPPNDIETLLKTLNLSPLDSPT